MTISKWKYCNCVCQLPNENTVIMYDNCEMKILQLCMTITYDNKITLITYDNYITVITYEFVSGDICFSDIIQ